MKREMERKQQRKIKNCFKEGKKKKKKERHDVSLEEVPAVFVCPLIGPSRALIVHHLRAKPKSHRALK